MPTSEHVEALAAAMAARPFDYYRHGGRHEPATVVAMKRRAERILAAVRTDPAVQDAVLAALIEGGRLTREEVTAPQWAQCADQCQVLPWPAHSHSPARWVRKARLVEPEWREIGRD
jgi:hypothetical protein